MAEEDGLRQILMRKTAQNLSPDNLPAMTLNNERQQTLNQQKLAAWFLTTNTQFLDHRTITFDALAFEIIEQTATLADDLEKATTGVVVFLVSAEMFRQIGDALREEGNLHFRGTRVILMGFEFFNDFLFAFCGLHGATSLIFVYELLSFSAVNCLKGVLSTIKPWQSKAFMHHHQPVEKPL
jgi:hypothetical protein